MNNMILIGLFALVGCDQTPNESCDTIPGDAYCDAIDICCDSQGDCMIYSGNDAYVCGEYDNCDSAINRVINEHCNF